MFKSETVINSIRGSGKVFSSDATSWGLQHEPPALQLYKNSERKKHKKLCVKPCGLVLYPVLEIIGASPDGIIQCDCCNPRCLEIKCPWTHRGLTIADFVAEKETCLKLESDSIVLDKAHMYYTQVQCQMAVTGRKCCDFFVCNSKGHHSTRVTFDEEFWGICMSKVTYFYHEMIIPQVSNKFEENSSECRRHRF